MAASPQLRRRPRASRSPAPGLIAPLALAAGIALLAPALGGDALADGIARAAQCDRAIDDGPVRWSDCIQQQRRALAEHPIAEAGLHFHAWRVAELATAQGVRGAAALRDAHQRLVAEALRVNRLSLHRLCTAAGADCTRLAQRLDGAV